MEVIQRVPVRPGCRGYDAAAWYALQLEVIEPHVPPKVTKSSRFSLAMLIWIRSFKEIHKWG